MAGTAAGQLKTGILHRMTGHHTVIWHDRLTSHFFIRENKMFTDLFPNVMVLQCLFISHFSKMNNINTMQLFMLMAH